jgi:hypothetical protein
MQRPTNPPGQHHNPTAPAAARSPGGLTRLPGRSGGQAARKETPVGPDLAVEQDAGQTWPGWVSVAFAGSGTCPFGTITLG